MCDPIALLCELIALPSVNPGESLPDHDLCGESRVVDHLEALFQTHGVACVRQDVLPGRQNLIAWVQGRSPHPVILEAHTDTVPVEGMRIAPFEPVVSDGRVCGRGACDDKASLAAMATALIRVAAEGAPERTCIMAATCDEEYKFRGIQRFVQEPCVPGLTSESLRGALACVGEPTGLDVITAHKGALRWQLRTRGRAAHSSAPEQGQNAIYRMVPLIARLERHAAELALRPGHTLLGGPTLSVGVIRGGTASNIVPDLCEALVDRRVIPGEDLGRVEAELRAALDEASTAPYELETVLEVMPVETPREAEVVRRMVGAVQAAGGRGEVRGVAYGTDASELNRVGAQCVVCGPGDIAQAHTAEEWVQISEVQTAADAYERFLRGV